LSGSPCAVANVSGKARLYLSHLQVGRRLGKGRCAMRITDSDSSWKRRE
jgi:hypothetical protein